MNRTERYQQLKKAYATEGVPCPISESEFILLSNEKFSKVCEILNRTKMEDLSVKPIQLSKFDKFGSDMLQSKDKILFDGDNLSQSIGKPVWLCEGSGDYFRLADGIFQTINRQEFTIENGILKSATKQPDIIKTPELIKQGFKKTMNNNTNSFWDRMARARELAARDSKEMTFKSELNPDAKSNLSPDKQSQFQADRAYLDGKSTDMFAKAEPIEDKPDELAVEPLLEAMSAEERTAYELSRTKAIRVMQSTNQPAPKTKQPTQEDLAFERARSVFSAKSKKQISPEMKARLIQLGYLKPE